MFSHNSQNHGYFYAEDKRKATNLMCLALGKSFDEKQKIFTGKNFQGINHSKLLSFLKKVSLIILFYKMQQRYFNLILKNRFLKKS